MFFFALKLKILKNTSELPLSEFLEKLKSPDYLVNEVRRSDKKEQWLRDIDGSVEEKIHNFNNWYLDFEDLSDTKLINSMRQKLEHEGEDYIGLVSLVNFKTSNL